MNKPELPTQPAPRRALGRGLDALLPQAAAAPVRVPAAAAAGGVNQIPLSEIQPNPFQPRRTFNDGQLEELAASIREQGLLQPIVVRPIAGGYQLIVGERRFRAAQMVGLTAVPALVRTSGDQQSLEMAIIENLQREDLNPIEQAEAFARLAGEFRLTQEQIGQKTGKDRASIANFLRLLKLEPKVRELIRNGALSFGQARPLIGLDPVQQQILADRIVGEGWSARRVEEHINQLGRSRPEPKLRAPRDPNLREAEDELARALGARVEIAPGKGKSGRVVIAYNDLEEFQRLYERLCHA